MTSPFTTANGWKLYKHPACGSVLDKLMRELSALTEAERLSYPNAKLLKRIFDLITVEVPQDPGADKYRRGNTLGSSHRHWYRAKFLQGYLLLFRFHSQQRVIIYAWLNDESTLRKQGAKSDLYAAFSQTSSPGRPTRRLG